MCFWGTLGVRPNRREEKDKEKDNKRKKDKQGLCAFWGFSSMT